MVATYHIIFICIALRVVFRGTKIDDVCLLASWDDWIPQTIQFFEGFGFLLKSFQRLALFFRATSTVLKLKKCQSEVCKYID